MKLHSPQHRRGWSRTSADASFPSSRISGEDWRKPVYFKIRSRISARSAMNERCESVVAAIAVSTAWKTAACARVLRSSTRPRPRQIVRLRRLGSRRSGSRISLAVSTSCTSQINVRCRTPGRTLHASALQIRVHSRTVSLKSWGSRTIEATFGSLGSLRARQVGFWDRLFRIAC